MSVFSKIFPVTLLLKKVIPFYKAGYGIVYSISAPVCFTGILNSPG